MELFRLKARYNQWMNQNLYRSCDLLTDQQRKQEMAAFFHSIHGTLNHILLADLVWLSRLYPHYELPANRLDQELYSDYDQLKQVRFELDQQIVEHMQQLSSAKLSADLQYKNMAGEAKQMPLALVLTHFFNHQTHHRGQITTLLNQIGLDVGVTDLIAMPEAVDWLG